MISIGCPSEIRSSIAGPIATVATVHYLESKLPRGRATDAREQNRYFNVVEYVRMNIESNSPSFGRHSRLSETSREDLLGWRSNKHFIAVGALLLANGAVLGGRDFLQ